MLASFQAWLAHPFATDMDWKRWIAFVALIMAALIFWNMILRHLESA